MSEAHRERGKERAPGGGRPHAPKLGLSSSSPGLRWTKPARGICIALILMTLFTAVVPFAYAGEGHATITVGVINVGAKIENFAVTPPAVTGNETVYFSFSLLNLGGSILHVIATSRIEIYRDATLVTTRPLSPPEAGIAPGSRADFTLSWNVENSPPDNYRALVIVDWTSAGHYSSNTAETWFKIIPHVPPPPPVVPVVPFIPVEKRLEVSIFPPLIELMPGESTLTSLTVTNPGIVAITDLQVRVSVAENWMLRAITVIPTTLDLRAGETEFVTILINVPAGTRPGDYGFKIKVSAGAVRAEVVSILRVRPLVLPSVTRTISVDRENNITTARLVVRNGPEFLLAYEIIEEIPKELAPNVHAIAFDIPPTEIIRPNPVVKWVLKALQPHETRTITYHVPGVFPTYADYLHWPVTQTTVTYEVVELIRILELKSEFIEPGETGRVTLMLQNNAGRLIAVTAELRLPIIWTAVPDRVSVELKPGESGSFVFYVTSPEYVEPAVYMGEIHIYFEDQKLVRGIVIAILPPVQQVAVEHIAAGMVGISVAAFAINHWRNNNWYKKRRDPKILELRKQIEEEE